MSGEFSPITTTPKAPVPRGWRWTLLEDVARLESGHTPSRRVPEYWDGGDIPWLSLKDIQGLGGRYIYDTQNHPTQLGIDNSSARVLPAGTVAFCRTASVGKTVILGRDMATSQDFVNWVCGPTLSPDYLYYAFRSSGAFFDQQKQGTTHKTIYFPTVKQFHVALPPLPEQKRIAAILDKSDAIRRKRQQAIRLTEELLRSAFLNMFGDPVTNPKGWEVKKLGDVTSFLTSGSRAWARYYSDQGAKFLRIQNVGRNQLLLDDLAFVIAPEGAEARRTSTQAGDIVLSITADLGRTGVVPEGFGQAHINQHLCLLRLGEGNPVFVSEYLASSGGQLQIKRADRVGVKSGLNFDDVRGLSVLFPPKYLQDQFATAHEKIRRHVELGLAGRSQIKDLSASLTQRAFSGRL